MIMPACKRQQPLPVSERDRHLVESPPLDIPTPVSVPLYAYPVSNDATQIYGFFCHQCHPELGSGSTYPAVQNLKSFYELSMPEVGWQQLSCAEGCTETVMVFKKPRKWCTLVLEPQRTRFYISPRRKSS